MEFKIITMIVAVFALTAFIVIQLAYEHPTGITYLFFEAQSIAIFIVNIAYFVALMAGDDFPDLHALISFLSLAYALCYGVLAIYLIISGSGELLEGFDPEIFDDAYKIEILVAGVLGLITSLLLVIEFALPFFTVELRCEDLKQA